MTKDEALILALETLKQIQEGCYNVIADKLHSDAVDLAKLVRKDCNKAIDAIRKSLAQPEQKPVAWMREDEDCSDCIVWEQTEEHTIPLYTTPPQRKPEQESDDLTIAYMTGFHTGKNKDAPQRTWIGLTGPEVVEAYRSVSNKEWAIGGLDDARVFFRAIEDKLREKNT